MKAHMAWLQVPSE